MSARALMLQGTGSDVGKSLLAAGLARAFTRRGLAVRPFKPQNMSNNAAVTAEGGEIGRAQALQARACGVAPSTDMNPVLLKPQTDVGAQLVVGGQVRGSVRARDYQHLKGELIAEVLAAYARLAAEAELVIVEGAGSPAEVNLRAGDIANMGFATAAAVPVVLVGDVDRGGVIASLCGTVALLEPGERALLAGYLVNRFRGDVGLFDGGIAAIAARTGLDCFGVVPWFEDAARLPAEDAVVLERRPASAPGAAPALRVAVPRLSRIANFDDLDPLVAEPAVEVEFVPPGRALPGDADLVVLPGSKATLADLELLRAEGWDVDIAAHLRRGGAVIGICAGFQMLGRRVADPDGREGAPGEAAGLGLLEVDTVLGGEKRLGECEASDPASGERLRGYEMHLGATTGAGLERPMLEIGGRGHGAVSADGRVMGCYLHGLFAADGFRHALIERIAARAIAGVGYEREIERVLDSLAAHLERHVDCDRLLAAARPVQNAAASASTSALAQHAPR